MGILVPCSAHTAGGQREPSCRSLPYPPLPGLCLLLREIPICFNNASTKPPSRSFCHHICLLLGFLCSNCVDLPPEHAPGCSLGEEQAAGWSRLESCTTSPCTGESLQPSVLAPGSSGGAAAASAPGKELQRAWRVAQGGEGPSAGCTAGEGPGGLCHSTGRVSVVSRCACMRALLAQWDITATSPHSDTEGISSRNGNL